MNNIKIVRVDSHVIVGFKVSGNWAGFCFGVGRKPSRDAVLASLSDV